MRRSGSRFGETKSRRITSRRTETAAGNESSGADGLEYTFTHSALVQIVNERGIVERAYPKASRQRDAVNTQVMVEDTRTVVGVDVAMRRREVLAGLGSVGVVAGAGAVAAFGVPSFDDDSDGSSGLVGRQHEPYEIETVDAPGSEAGTVTVPAGSTDVHRLLRDVV